jgi:hypothetical protein
LFGTSGEFRIVVEARPGISGLGVATANFTTCGSASGMPNVQIESSQRMGNGSNPVCSSSGAFNVNGGIPGIDPPDFTPTSDIINTLQSFAIWFTYQSPGSACTLKPGGDCCSYVSPSTTAQFCDKMNSAQSFPPGDSLVTVQLRDTGGNVGPAAQIIVRVATWTPVPTSTSTFTATPSPTPT